MTVENFQLGSLMEHVPALMYEAFAAIRSYSTAFIVNNELIGSATFVRIGDHVGFLTGKHVWDALCRLTAADPLIGVQLYDRQHAFFVDHTKLVPLYESTPRTEAFGPDMAFIKIPVLYIGSIEASQKVIYNLSKSAGARHVQAKSRFGFLIISGSPAEKTEERVLGRAGRPLLRLFNLGMIVAKTRQRRLRGHDYWEMQTHVGSKPRDYGGVSGAGVWRVVLEKKTGTPFSAAKLKSVSLAGVAFYQSSVKLGWRFIRAHGPDSIYEVLGRAVQQAT